MPKKVNHPFGGMVTKIKLTKDNPVFIQINVSSPGDGGASP